MVPRSEAQGRSDLGMGTEHQEKVVCCAVRKLCSVLWAVVVSAYVTWVHPHTLSLVGTEVSLLAGFFVSLYSQT